ncbi:MAG: zinc-binding dehydrogenase [Chloroflexi bacterium]|nr:zinc-binding dehydrogenase [Chloroflexota bacterium]
MKAAQFHEYGGPEVLRYEDTADPVPLPSEALIRVRACGVNHVDLDHRAGTSRYPHRFPHILGYEMAGEVLQAAADGSGPAVGTPVLVPFLVPCRHCELCETGRDNLCPNAQRFGSNRPGGYAELTAAPAKELLPLPAGLSYEEAAALQLAFGTAWHMLLTRGRLRAGETVLVNAAGSGIGSAAVQIAKLAGARVIATAGSDAKLAAARDLGADEAVNYRESGWAAEIRRLTGGRGVDLVFEHVGGEIFTESLDALALDGRIAICGAHAGEVVSLDLIALFRLQAQLIGSRVYNSAELKTLLALVAAGKLRPVVFKAIPLAEAAEAHRLLDRREQFGKVVLVP